MKKVEEAPIIKESDCAKAVEVLSNKQTLVKKYNSEYRHWSELKYREDDRISMWAALKTVRKSMSQHFVIDDIEFSFTIIPEFQKMLYEIDRCQPGIYENNIFSISSMMEEAITSSQIEGAVSTREDAKKMLRSGRSPKTIDERMILNNYLAMEHIKKCSDMDLTEELIFEIHEIITNGTIDKEYVGKFRNTDKIVVGDDEGNVFHIPPEYKKIKKLISELCNFVNKEEFIHPVVKASILHFLIGYIHPFIDGNGRLARSLFYWYLLKKKYTIMEYTSISRIMKNSIKKYGLAYMYSETDENDLTYFIKYNLECVNKSIDELKKYVSKKMKEHISVRETMNIDSNLTTGEMMILGDYSKDIFSIREISSRYSISYQSARNHVMHLLDEKLIKASSKNRKTVMYSVCTK